MKKSVLLYGFYGISNAGNEAMLRALIEPIRKHFSGEIEFVVANRHPSEEYDKEYEVRSIDNLEYATRDLARGRWLSGLNPDDSPELMKLLSEVADSDLVIFGPGQYFVETGELGLLKGSLAQFHILLMLAKLTHTPFYALAMACEPLSSPWSILTIDSALKQCDILTFRDPQSIQNLENAGIQVPEYQVLGDLALAAQAADPEIAVKLFQEYGVPAKSGPRLAVSLRSLYWLDIDHHAMNLKLSRAISLWLEKWKNSDVIMIPQNTYNIDGNRDDDRVANKAVYDLIPENLQGRIFQFTGEYSPEQIESLYSTADTTLTSRLHGSVFSCKQGVPPVVLTFMDKTKGFYKRLGFPDRMITLEATADDLFHKLTETYGKHEELSAGILSSVEAIRKTASNYSKIAITMLENENINNEKKEWARTIID